MDKIIINENFGFVLNEEETFNPTEYKVMNNQFGNKLVYCVKQKFNGDISLYYDISGAEKLSNAVSGMNVKEIWTVVSDIIWIVMTVADNGFLRPEKILLETEPEKSLDKIYIGTEDGRSRMIYLPMNIETDILSFYRKLTGLLNYLAIQSGEMNDRTIRFLSELSKENLDFKALFEVASVDINHDRYRLNHDRHFAGRTKLKALSSLNQNDLIVSELPYLIGKNPLRVNGVITVSEAVSRVHCKLSEEQEQLCITDLDSMNGTFVNSTKLVPGQPCRLTAGDWIRIADTDFEVVLE